MIIPEPETKLSCRHLWKVFGNEPQAFFDGKSEVDDPGAVAARLREANHLPAVVDASFDVGVGQIFVIVGLSGSGKSTLVRCLSRLHEPTAGEIWLDGENLLKARGRSLIEMRRHKMGMVFQSFGLLPHLTVLENVAFPLKIQGQPRHQREARAREMVGLVGLEGREGSYPHQLSGGQQQRVGIARSLAVGPELWFLDEPFSALDPLIRRQMQEEFVRLQQKLKKTIVFITHDMTEAFRLADRIAIMRGGVIVQLGRPAELALEPADDYVASFIEDMSLMRVITAGDLAIEDEGFRFETAPEHSVAADICVEEVMPRVVAGVRAFAVPSGGDAPPRILTAEAVLDTLERDIRRRTAAP